MLQEYFLRYFILFFSLLATNISTCLSELYLENSYFKVGINSEGKVIGSIFSIYNKSLEIETEFNAEQNEGLFFLESDDFVLESTHIIKHDDTNLIFELHYSSSSNYSNLICLIFRVHYEIIKDKIITKFKFFPQFPIRLNDDLEIKSQFSNISKIFPYNHYLFDEIIQIIKDGKTYFQVLNQRYQILNLERNIINIISFDPYRSLVKVEDQKSGVTAFSYVMLPSYKPWKAIFPEGPKIASLVDCSDSLSYEYELFLSDSVTCKRPVSYFSPFPSGYDQVISMIFDDIPFYRWVIPPANDPTDPSGQDYLIQLLEEHPQMKMSWVVVPDALTSPGSLENPDYPQGQWWLAHGVHRLSKYAPVEYKTWMQRIENDQVVLGYENRVHIGGHGYHHTPEMQFGNNWEFQTFDSLRDQKTFDMIENDFKEIGLTKKSLRFMRFPGFKCTRSVIDALAQHNYLCFDFDTAARKDKLPIFLYYFGPNRIWAIQTNWEGDTPKTYEDMKFYLNKGKYVNTAGHPSAWFNHGDEDAYQIRHNIFEQAEEEFENLGYLYFSDYASIANELFEVCNFQIKDNSCGIDITFDGKITNNQTLVIENFGNRQIDKITVDDNSIVKSRIDDKKLKIILPILFYGSHKVKISYKFSVNDTFENLYFHVFPIPSLNGKYINIENIPSDFDILIFNELGALVNSFKAKNIEQCFVWNLKNFEQQDVSSGIYFITIKSRIHNLTKVKKVVVIK